MNAIETGKLLGLMAHYDNRNVGPSDVAAWLRIPGWTEIPYAAAEAAVLAHYGDSRERMMPADVRGRVNEARRERLENAPVLDPPHEVADDPAAYREWLEREQRKIADGGTGLRAVES